MYGDICLLGWCRGNIRIYMRRCATRLLGDGHDDISGNTNTNIYILTGRCKRFGTWFGWHWSWGCWTFECIVHKRVSLFEPQCREETMCWFDPIAKLNCYFCKSFVIIIMAIVIVISSSSVDFKPFPPIPWPLTTSPRLPATNEVCNAYFVVSTVMGKFRNSSSTDINILAWHTLQN